MAMNPDPRKEFKADSAPQKLIEAARHCLIEKGHAVTSVKVIAAQAGVNHGLVHHYFGSKEGLYAAMVEQLDKQISAEIEQLQSRMALQEFLVEIVFVRARLLNEIYSLARHLPQVRSRFSSFLEKRRIQIGLMLGIEDSVLQRLFTATLQGLAIQSQVDRNLPVYTLIENLIRVFETRSEDS